MSPAERHILHVDMDAFFASVEELDDPSLAGRPVIVGGTGPRGVVASASYAARIFGVRSAMPTAMARRRCPAGVFLPPRPTRYGEVSGRIMALLGELTPLVEQLSVDEAWLDVTGARRRLGAPREVAARIRAEVRAREGLECAVGVASNKFVAKLASSRAKPVVEGRRLLPGEGVVVVAPEGVRDFLDPLPIRDLWGVGPATAAELGRRGVVTVGDLARLPGPALAAAVGATTGEQLHRLARGLDDRPVDPGPARRSISQEVTFAADPPGTAELHAVLVGQADVIGGRLRAAGLVARRITLKVRYSEGFRTVTRSHTLADPTDDGVALLGTADQLLGSLEVHGGIRLVGLAVGGLEERRAEQLSFDAAGGPPRDAANRAVDDIRRRFGAAAIVPARTLDGGR